MRDLGIKKFAGALALGVPLVFAAPQAQAVPVGLELVLLVDVSGSVDATEFALQKTGYVQAFQSAAVQNAILASVGGAIAVTYIEWSGSAQQSQAVGWTLINSAASANAFAAAINGTARAFNGQTAPGSAINFALPLFGSEVGESGNGFESARQVMDVSGDGAQNQGADTSDARDNALNVGVDTINGLAILGEAGLQAFYQNNIVGGGGFLVLADDFADFGAAIQDKLIREISNVPEPATLALFGAGLAALALMRRRRTL